MQKKREIKYAMVNLSLHGLAIDLKFSAVYFLSEFWRYSFMDQTIVAFYVLLFLVTICGVICIVVKMASEATQKTKRTLKIEARIAKVFSLIVEFGSKE